STRMLKQKSPAACDRAFAVMGNGRPLLGRHDRHGLLVQRALEAELNLAVDQREQGVVLADADVGAGVETGAALAHDDRASRDLLAAKNLDAQSLRFRVATVTRRAAALFLCHVDSSC